MNHNSIAQRAILGLKVADISNIWIASALLYRIRINSPYHSYRVYIKSHTK